jgi:hypothetical protein
MLVRSGDPAGYQRPLFRQTVTWKVKTGSIRFSSPDDYAVTDFKDLDTTAARALDMLPYCFDPASQRMMFTILNREDVDAVLDAPFLYIGQRLKSVELLSVPFERLAEFDDALPLAPVFIFSPGRTGSTLLSRMLSAAGCSSVSEPDILTQVSRLGAIDNTLIGKGGASLIIRACIASLAAYVSHSPYIKLRSQCSQNAELIASAIPGSKSAFLFRNVMSWAWSRHQQFGDTPFQLVEMLATNIDRFDALDAKGLAPVLLIYERLLSDPLRELKLLAPQLDLADAGLQNAVEAIRLKDSQEGTDLRRKRRNAKPVSKGFERDFFRRWDLVKSDALIAKHGLEPIFRN